MKLLIAIIQPDKLDEVRESLYAHEIYRITVSRCTGHGQQIEAELHRGQEVPLNLIPKVRIEIAVNDAFVQPAIDAILKSARHNGGKVGDGKIFIQPLEECIRIRTGERGGAAI